MNPADLMPEVIRQQCSMFNISNAAILFDDNFVVDHKYKSLLLNVPTRHVIVHTKEPGTPVQRQISMLRDLDIVNFFVLGSEPTISAALQAANNLNFTGHKFGWFGVTLTEDFTARCTGCKNVSLMLFKPQAATNQQQLSELTSKGTLYSLSMYVNVSRVMKDGGRLKGNVVGESRFSAEATDKLGVLLRPEQDRRAGDEGGPGRGRVEATQVHRVRRLQRERDSAGEERRPPSPPEPGDERQRFSPDVRRVHLGQERREPRQVRGQRRYYPDQGLEDHLRGAS